MGSAEKAQRICEDAYVAASQTYGAWIRSRMRRESANNQLLRDNMEIWKGAWDSLGRK